MVAELAPISNGARQKRPAPAKITHKTRWKENRPQDNREYRPQDRPKNRPDIINPVSLWGVCGEGELQGLLRLNRMFAWDTRVRVRGLLLLIDYICRNLKKGCINISAGLAHQFVSKLGKQSRSGVPTEPLLLLSKIGILTRVRPAVFAHVKTSAVYSFAEKHQKIRLNLKVNLTPKLASKRQNATARCERRLNRKYPFREQLLTDLNAISFAQPAGLIIASGIKGEGGDNLKLIFSAVEASKHWVRVSERGQITTSIGSCTRELQPHLLLHNEATDSCDMSHAHWNFLPLILANRLRYVAQSPGREKYISDGWNEHALLTLALSDGDFYRRWCFDPTQEAERDKKKNVLNMLLNRKNEECRNNRLYRWIAKHFPITFGTIEDIKQNDHRNIGKQLHRFTADAIQLALIDVQEQRIAAIPLVDSIICQQRHAARVCEAIGRQIFLATGSCAKVGGKRYSPLTEAKNRHSPSTKRLLVMIT